MDALLVLRIFEIKATVSTKIPLNVCDYGTNVYKRHIEQKLKRKHETKPKQSKAKQKKNNKIKQTTAQKSIDNQIHIVHKWRMNISALTVYLFMC